MQITGGTPRRLALVATAAIVLMRSSLLTNSAHAAKPADNDPTFISASELDALASNESAALASQVFLEGVKDSRHLPCRERSSQTALSPTSDTRSPRARSRSPTPLTSDERW